MNIDIGVSMFACVVGAIFKSPYAVACVFPSIHPHFKFTPISNSPPLQIRHVTIHPHSQSPPCYNLPPFQIHPCYKSPYAVACVFPQIANITNSLPLQIVHVFNRPHVEGLIAISPYTCVIRTFANIHVNMCKYL